jgi:hypothetical protein
VRVTRTSARAPSRSACRRSLGIWLKSCGAFPRSPTRRLRYHYAIRASDIRALGTLTGLTALAIQGEQGAPFAELDYLYPLEFAQGDRLQEANRPVAIGELTSLTSLHLTGCSTYVAEELGMERCHGLEWRAPSLAKLTALTSLHIGGGCWNIYDEHMEELSNLPALTYIHLECWWYSDEPDMRLWELASRLPGLTHLHLSDGVVTNDGLRAIASLSALTHLHLDGLEQMSNEGLRAIASLTSLTQLRLQYFVSVTDEGVAMLSSLTALKSLDLEECPNGSQAAITALRQLLALD